MRAFVLALIVSVLISGALASCSTPKHNNPAPTATIEEPIPTLTLVPSPAPIATPTATPTTAPTPRVRPTLISTPSPTSTPTIPTWPIVEVNWKYIYEVVPTPSGVDTIYSGEADAASTNGDDTWKAQMAIARRIIPESMINGELLTLAIVRNPDNPNIRLAGITIYRGSRFMLGAKVGEKFQIVTFESHLYLTTDAEKSWVEIRIPPGDAGEYNVIERVRVSGTSTLLLSWRGGIAFYTQAELTL